MYTPPFYCRDITAEASFYVRQHPDQPPLFDYITIERTREFDSLSDRARLIVWTSRPIEADGGDGWHGVDAETMDRLASGLERYVDETGLAGMVTGFTIRQIPGAR